MDYSFFEKQNYLHLKELADELEIKEYKNNLSKQYFIYKNIIYFNLYIFIVNI
jgi:hypothetical protein